MRGNTTQRISNLRREVIGADPSEIRVTWKNFVTNSIQVGDETMPLFDDFINRYPNHPFVKRLHEND